MSNIKKPPKQQKFILFKDWRLPHFVLKILLMNEKNRLEGPCDMNFHVFSFVILWCHQRGQNQLVEPSSKISRIVNKECHRNDDFTEIPPIDNTIWLMARFSSFCYLQVHRALDVIRSANKSLIRLQWHIKATFVWNWHIFFCTTKPKNLLSHKGRVIWH